VTDFSGRLEKDWPGPAFSLFVQELMIVESSYNHQQDEQNQD
jgi:hypothetical protein